MHIHPSLQRCALYPTLFPFCSLLIAHGETKPCSLEALALSCSITSCLPSHLSSPCAECSNHPKINGNSHVLLWGRGKSLDLVQCRGRRVSRQEAKHQQEQALALHGCNGELPAELGASLLAPSTRLLKSLMHVTKACNPVLPEFVSYEAPCLT